MQQLELKGPRREERKGDAQATLADTDGHRDVTLPAIQAPRAAVGKETTSEHAEGASCAETEADKTAFFDLEKYREGKGRPDRREEMFVRTLREEARGVRFDVPRRDFSAIEGAPLAYRRVRLVSRVFREAPALEPHWAIAVVGLQTSDDERFVRCHWEVRREDVGEGRTWVPFAKGGEFSRFYSDVHLVVQWRENGRDIRRFEGAYIRNEKCYFKPGLTWPLRTQRGFNLRVLPSGCVFGHKGPALFPSRENDNFLLLGVANSALAEFMLQGLMVFGSWEVGVIKRLPVPVPSTGQKSAIAASARSIHDGKGAWDEGNETSTRFRMPWLLREDLVERASSIPDRLTRLAELETAEETRIQKLYAELNDEVYRLYGFSLSDREAIEETLGKRPPEVLWPGMERATADQKRKEHVWRLLSYVVKRVMEADEDGVVPYAAVAGEPALFERVLRELAGLFPGRDVNQLEIEIANELKRAVKGYRRVGGIADWLNHAFFEYHASLYKNRPIFWHIASSQGTSPLAFGALVHYHKFDRDRLAKLRGRYLREAMEEFRREAALADKENRPEDRLEWQSRLEEAQGLDRKLQWIEEGFHQGAEGGDRDFRILTPWKSSSERPKGWDPDLDDDVKANIEPLRKAGVLRVSKGPA